MTRPKSAWQITRASRSGSASSGTNTKKWLVTEIEPLLQLRREASSGKASAEDVTEFIQSGKGKQSMDAMRDIVKTIENEERKLLEQRSGASQKLETTMYTVLLIGGAAGGSRRSFSP